MRYILIILIAISCNDPVEEIIQEEVCNCDGVIYNKEPNSDWYEVDRYQNTMICKDSVIDISIHREGDSYWSSKNVIECI